MRKRIYTEIPDRGRHVAGRYTLHETIGAGGMATVWRATHHGAAAFSRGVAIKKLRPEFRKLQQYLAMFVEESRIGSELQHPNIVAIKDASGEVGRVTDLLSRCNIKVLSGDDALAWPLMALGAVGVVSVLSNLTPSLMKSLTDAAAEEDIRTVLPMHRKVCDLALGLGRFGPNPVPIKTAMEMRGLMREEFRLPLCPLGDDDRAGIKAVLRRHELLERTVA